MNLKEARNVLKPWSDRIAQLNDDVNALESEELAAIVYASVLVSPTNIWWATYQAAQWLGPEAQRELQRRAAARAEDESEPA